MLKLIKPALAPAIVAGVSLSLAGCFPQGFTGLPLVDRSLSSESPEGIWMIVTEENSSIPNTEDSMNPYSYTGMTREFVKVTANEQGVYELTRCDSEWRKDYEVTATETGYEASLTETGEMDESGVTVMTLTDLTVTFANNNRSLSAEGSRVTTPVGESTTLTLEGVKVSDSTSFEEAPELTSSYGLDYTNLGNAGVVDSAVANCIGIEYGEQLTEQGGDDFIYTENIYTFYDESDRQTQYYRFYQNSGDTVTESLGAIINTEEVFTLYVNACGNGETACSAAAEWTETSSNSIAGVSFDINYEVIDNTYVINPLALTPWTAFLWPHDGDFMHAQVSVTIDSYQQYED